MLTLALLLAPPALADTGWDLARRVMNEGLFTDSMIEWTRDPHPAVRKAAFYRLIESPDTRLEEVCLRGLADPVWSVRRMAIMALEPRVTERARVPLEKITAGTDSTPVRARAVMALAKLADARSMPLFEKLLSDSDFVVRGTTAKEVANFKDTRVLEKLKELIARDTFAYVACRANEAFDRFNERILYPNDRTTYAKGSPWYSNTIWTMIIAVAFTTLLFIIAVIVLMTLFPRRQFFIFFAGVLLFILCFFFVATGAPMPPRLDKLPEIIIQSDPAFRHHPFVASAGTDEKAFIAPIIDSIRSSGVAADIRLEESPADLAFALHSGRQQYDMDAILKALARDHGKSPHVILTGNDLYVEPFYVTMGRAEGVHAVFSLHRLDPIFQGEGSGTIEDRAILIERLTKLAVHEIGHMRGLGHCNTARCIMRSVEEANEEFFRLDVEFCSFCKGRL